MSGNHAKNSVTSGSIQTLNRMRVIQFYRIVLRIGITIVFLFFVKQLFQNVQIPHDDTIFSGIFVAFVIALYAYSWYFGCNRDLYIQSVVLVDVPKPKFVELLISVIILAAFLILFTLVEQRDLLARAFLAFLSINVFGWIWLKKKVKKYLEDSIGSYEKAQDNFGLIMAKIYEDYMFGKWQWWRFCTGFLAIIILISLALGFLPPLRGYSANATFALCAFLVVFILEVWMWYERVKVKFLFDGLEWMKENGYTVTRDGQ